MQSSVGKDKASEPPQSIFSLVRVAFLGVLPTTRMTVRSGPYLDNFT